MKPFISITFSMLVASLISCGMGPSSMPAPERVQVENSHEEESQRQHQNSEAHEHRESNSTEPEKNLRDESPFFGIRNDREINATMSALTGVPTLEVAADFAQLQLQLPASNDLKAFSSSQQVAISKLALVYCERSYDTLSTRTDVYGTSLQVTNPAQRQSVLSKLVQKFWGTDLNTIPESERSVDELSVLTEDLLAGTETNEEGLRAVLIGVCTSILASSPTIFL